MGESSNTFELFGGRVTGLTVVRNRVSQCGVEVSADDDGAPLLGDFGLFLELLLGGVDDVHIIFLFL